MDTPENSLLMLRDLQVLEQRKSGLIKNIRDIPKQSVEASAFFKLTHK